MQNAGLGQVGDAIQERGCEWWYGCIRLMRAWFCLDVEAICQQWLVTLASALPQVSPGGNAWLVLS